MAGAAGPATAIAAIILAAGRSTRAGDINKLTAEVHGTPMIARVADRVLASGAAPVIVVTGHQAEAVRAALAGRAVAFAHNPDYADGIATSIAAGIRALPETAAGALICLGDMPALESGDIQRVMAAFKPGAICVPVAGGRQGNPVLFARAFFAELASLTGDRGAKSLIAKHSPAVTEVALSGEGALVDLDTERAIADFNRCTRDD